MQENIRVGIAIVHLLAATVPNQLVDLCIGNIAASFGAYSWLCV